MKIEARELRLADVVRLPGDGEREIRRVQKDGDQVRAWYRGDEENEQPSVIWAGDVELEIQRPGDLFPPAPEAPTPTSKKRLPPLDANAVLVEELKAKGWVHKPRGWGVNEFITDPTDTVRLRIAKDGTAEWMTRLSYNYVGRWYDARRYGWTPELVEDLDATVAKLLEKAAVDVGRRAEMEGRALEQAVARTQPTTVPAHLGLTLRYSQKEGVLLCGATSTHYEIIKKERKPYRYRYSKRLPNGCRWYVPRTRGTYQPRARVELAAASLRAHGIPVELEYEGESTTTEVPATPPAATPPSTPAARPTGPTDEELAALAKGFGVEPGPIKPEFRHVREALLAAERKGWGAKLRAWINRNRIVKPDEAAVLYGWVRGQLAFERGDWPPPPERGETYGRDEFRGVIRSIGTEQQIAAILDFGPQWKVQVEKLTGRRSSSWYRDHDFYSWVRTTVYDVAGEFERRGILDAYGRGETPTPELAKQALADTRRQLADYETRMRTSLDPSLYDPKTDPGSVYRKLCSVGTEVAERVLRDVHGVRFPERGDASELCRGETDLSTLARKADAAAKVRAEQEAEAKRKHQADALALLAVYEAAKASGPVTSGRFNRMYWKMHPEIGKWSRDERRMRASWSGGGFVREKGIAPAGKVTEVDVRGPTNWGFRTTTKEGTEEAAVAAIVAEIRKVAGVTKSTESKPRAKKTTMKSTNDQSFDIVALKEAWRGYEKSIEKGGTGWTPIPGTSCFKHEDDESLTLCTAYQTKAIGACPPSMAGLSAAGKQLMLCQPGHEPEFFRGQEPGIVAAKAEAANRVVRSRSRRPATEPRVDALPDALDFAGQAAWLASVVPSGIVYKKDDPLRPIPLAVAAPLIVTPDGESLSVPGWPVRREVPAGSVLMPALSPSQMRLDSFVRRLGTELLPYRGPIGVKTLQILASLASGASVAPGLRKAKMTLADFRSATIDGKTVYWIPAPDGSIAAGPITATGRSVSNRKVIAALSQLATTGLPLTELPEGSTLDDTIIVAVLRQGAPMWWAWNTRTLEFRSKSGEDGQWSKPQVMPATSTWKEKGGYSDFPHVSTHTLELFLEAAPPGAGFRVAGPWLGYLFPSDFNGKVVFDEPTGGELDLAAIERELMETAEHLPEGSDPIAHGRWSKLAAKRLRWARKRLAAADKANRPSTRRGLEQAAKRATRTPAPTRKPEPVAASSSKRDEENDMSAKKSKTKSTGKKKKAAAAKKTAAKNAAAKKAAARKAAAKKAAAKKAAAKKAAAKKTQEKSTKKRAAKKTTTKKPTTNGSATQKRSSTSAATQPSMPPTPVANGKAPTPADETDRPRRRLRFNRNDTVRFRKRSQIAAGLGVGLDKEFKVEMVTTQEGRPMVVLRVGQGKHSALIKVPPGHLAIVNRGDEIPASIRSCAARLAEFKGPITPKTRRVLAELARRA